MKTLHSVKDVIAELGGRQAFADLTGASIKAIAHWRWQNQFPAKTYLVVSDALTKRDCAADVGLWSFDEPANTEAAE